MKQIIERQVEIEGKIINFVDIGRGETIVFIHGAANNWQSWWPVAKYLKNKYRVILVDLPGFGKSSKLPEYSMKIAAEWLKKLTDKLKLKKICLTGNSMGAGVAAKFGQMYPEKIKKIILISAIYRRKKRRMLVKLLDKFYEEADKRVSRQDWLKKISEQKFFSYLAARWFSMDKFKKRLIDRYVLKGKKQMDARAYTQMNKAMIKMRMAGIIGEIKKPVLVICGSKDKLTECKLWPRAIKIERAGHLLIWERPKRVAEEIDRFVQRAHQRRAGRSRKVQRAGVEPA